MVQVHLVLPKEIERIEMKKRIFFAGAGGDKVPGNKRLFDICCKLNKTNPFHSQYVKNFFLLEWLLVFTLFLDLWESRKDGFFFIAYSRGCITAIRLANLFSLFKVNVYLITIDPVPLIGRLRVFENVVALNHFQKEKTDRRFWLIPYGAKNPYKGSMVKGAINQYVMNTNHIDIVDKVLE